jgi:hypothetical protein
MQLLCYVSLLAAASDNIFWLLSLIFNVKNQVLYLSYSFSIFCCFVEKWINFYFGIFPFDHADAVAGGQWKSNEIKEEVDLQTVLENHKKAVMQGSLVILMVYVSFFPRN